MNYEVSAGKIASIRIWESFPWSLFVSFWLQPSCSSLFPVRSFAGRKGNLSWGKMMRNLAALTRKMIRTSWSDTKSSDKITESSLIFIHNSVTIWCETMLESSSLTTREEEIFLDKSMILRTNLSRQLRRQENWHLPAMFAILRIQITLTTMKRTQKWQLAQSAWWALNRKMILLSSHATLSTTTIESVDWTGFKSRQNVHCAAQISPKKFTSISKKVMI